MGRPSDDIERGYMRRALTLAERGRGAVSPNPVVGAVLVRDGRVVGEGWHRALGEPHAEFEALSRAGSKARGATLYVTLEPCAHSGRTPPCADALIGAGIRRCVVAVRDPHRIVDGRGLAKLARAGISVRTGVCAGEARVQLGGYWFAHTRARPRVTWKAAATLDGRIADQAGHSRWITGRAARTLAHRMRARADAVVIGARTARTDDPRLTARGVRTRRQPLRVICDTGLSLPLGLKLYGRSLASGTVVACGPRAPRLRAARLEERGVSVWRLPLSRGGVSPLALARRLVRAGCHEVLLEGGAALGSSWFRAGLVDRVALMLAPRLLGEPGFPWCAVLGIGSLARARAGRFVRSSRLGEDALLVVDFGG